MDPDNFTVGGFDLGHLILIIIAVGCLAFLLYWFWMWPCGGGDGSQGAEVTSRAGWEGRVISLPNNGGSSTTAYGKEGVVLYAMEIEPGIVVLQDQDGDLFRILQECDSVRHQGSSAASIPPGTSYPVHYIPSYTRAHMQTRPSAPLLPPEYTPPSDVQGDWRPLCVQSGAGY